MSRRAINPPPIELYVDWAPKVCRMAVSKLIACLPHLLSFSPAPHPWSYDTVPSRVDGTLCSTSLWAPLPGTEFELIWARPATGEISKGGVVRWHRK
jgi:hypothetical protein